MDTAPRAGAPDEPESRIGRRRRTAKAGAAANYAVRRAEIVRVAAQVFQGSGYERATFQDVADRLCTERASLYYYFASKEELLREIVLDAVLRNLAVTAEIAAGPASAQDKLQLFVARLMDSYEQSYPQMYVFIQQDLDRGRTAKTALGRQLSKAARACEAQLIGILQQGVGEGCFRSDIPLALVANAAFGMLNWTHRWFKPGGPYAAADIARHFSRILLHGTKLPAEVPRQATATRHRTNAADASSTLVRPRRRS